MSAIDFGTINKAALRSAKSLLTDLIPGGAFRGQEYIVRNPRRYDQNPGSFSINYRTGVWKDFSSGDGGNDLISLVAFVHGIGQGEAARVLAEKLAVPLHKANGIASAPKANGALSAGSLAGAGEAKDGAAAKVYRWGEEGPPVGRDEIRRHYYPKNGTPKRKVKIKKRNEEWTTCYRVFCDNVPIGWQYEKPAGYRSLAYEEVGTDTQRIFWPEGEKDNDTLNKFGFTAFTFGGGDGVPNDIDEYLKHIFKHDSTLIIAIDNDVGGRKQGQKKARKAHTCGIKHVRIFDIATVWPQCTEGEDVTDWFEKGGGTCERLIEIVDALPDLQPSANDDDTSTKEDDAGASWDYPDLSLLDDRRGELPAFPLDGFSYSWQKWATSAAHGAGTTVDHVLTPLLSISSSLIGTARRLRASRSWSEPFTSWTAIVGYSGTGKTPGLAVSERALARIESNRKHRIGELRRAHDSKIERAEAAKKQWQKKVKDAVEAGQKAPDMPADAEVPEPFEAPRLFVSNATIEKLAKLLLPRPQGMLLICDELAGLFLNLSRYSGGSDREFSLEAWNGTRTVSSA